MIQPTNPCLLTMFIVILNSAMISSAAGNSGASKAIGAQICSSDPGETLRFEADDSVLFSSELSNENYYVPSLGRAGSLYRDQVRYRSWKQTKVRWRNGKQGEIFRPGPQQRR